jgi:predicted amidohydrolase YtcJ
LDPPSLILTNGKIWTGEGADSFVEAVAITGNTITQVGDSKTISALATADTEVIDLQGKLVTAGFNDAHIHFLSGSIGLTQVDLWRPSLWMRYFSSPQILFKTIRT